VIRARFQIAGELRDGFANFYGVFPSGRSWHPRADSGLRRHDFGGAMIRARLLFHLMAQVGELFVQPGDLLGVSVTDSVGKAIGGIIAQSGPEINWFRAERF